MPGRGVLSLVLVFFSVRCVVLAYTLPQDACKTGDDGITLKDCRRTTEVEKCPNETEWYDEKFDRVTVCCCSCHPGYLTHKDSGSIICHRTKPSQKPDFPTTSAHPTPEKAYTEARFNDSSTVSLTVMPNPGTTSPPTPPETATTSGSSTSDANVTSPGQEPEKVSSDSLIVGVVFGVIGVMVIVLVLVVRKKLHKSVYSSCKNLNENVRLGQNLQNGELGNGAEDQNEARNDDEGNGDIANQDAEAQRNLLEEDDVPQLED